MRSRRFLPCGLQPIALLVALALSPVAAAIAQQAPKPFKDIHDSALKRSLLQAWQAERRAAAPRATQAPGGALTSIVGRASMVINGAGTVVYTRTVLGGTCDVRDVRAQFTWQPNHVYAVGSVVAPTASPGQPNGFDGFNFQTSGGTSGATEPTWPTSGIGATVGDNGMTWTAIAFDPANFVGCTPMQVVSRASGGAETVIAQEGDTLSDGSQLAGWSEFIAANGSGQAAFRAALAGYPFSDRDDEGESGIFTAGPGAGQLTRIAATSTTIGGRSICGFSAMVAINDAGQVVFDGLSGLFNGQTFSCNEDNHSLIRFTSGPGNELLVEQGSSVGGATVIGFGNDDDSGVSCTGCSYQHFDGRITSAGHVPAVVNLSDGTQGVFVFTGPGTSTPVARTGGANPYTALSARTAINNSDQVVFKGVSGGVTRIFRFTPPSTTVTIASVGDVVNGQTITSLGSFFDINSAGKVVFQAGLAGSQDGFYFYDGAVHEVTRVATGSQNTTLASELITINDSDLVAYVTGSDVPENYGPDDAAEGHEAGGIFFWTLAAGSSPAIVPGDVISGATVASIYAQHPSFAKRQLSSAGCVATAYVTGTDDAEMDCTEGDPATDCYGGAAPSPRLFVSCGAVCPTISLAPPTLPAATQGTPYNQSIIASGGTAPYTYAVTSGTLPSGLTLSAGGSLTGTPTVQGTFPFTVTATDASSCTGSQAYSLVVGAPTQVTVALNPPSRTIVVGTNGNLTVSINIRQSTDTVVTLSSANPGIVAVPASVTILANQLSASFIANGVTIGGPVTITATLPPSFQASPATAAVTVIAPAAAVVPTVGVFGLVLIGVLLAATAILLLRR